MLASIVTFAVSGLTERAEEAVAAADLKTIETALEAYYVNTGQYPRGNSTQEKLEELVAAGLLRENDKLPGCLHITPDGSSAECIDGPLIIGADSDVITNIDRQDYRIVTWLEDGYISLNESLEVEYLVVGGGGSGGNRLGGGGGGGGFLTSEASVTPSSYAVMVGIGGEPPPLYSLTETPSAGLRGGDSSVFGAVAVGGGGGGSLPGIAGQSGGSGGGGANNPLTSGGSGNTLGSTPPQGYDGAQPSFSHFGTEYFAGGGGGASEVGEGGNKNRGGRGGNGKQSAITGALITYAGGGGGARNTSLLRQNNGGTGGGGGGASQQSNGGDGINGLGGGGGGAGNPSNFTTTRAGAGGSGIVILRWPV